MALVDFLYRCPCCGHDPAEDQGPRVRCPECRRRFEFGSGGTCIRILEEGEEGAGEEVPAAHLARRMEAMGGPLARARDDDGRIVHESGARVRFAREETPVRFRGRLLGFYELFGGIREGRLRLEHDRLSFREERGEGAPLRTWKLPDLRALQTSSSSVQISPVEGGVVLFRFPDDSVRRWEELLKAALRETWEAEGRGQIVEFQPRIRAQ